MGSIMSFARNILRSTSNNATLFIETASGKTTTFVCQFNPDELNISAQGHFSTHERQGEDSPIVQFLGGTCAVLDLKLFFDTSSSYELTGPISTPKKNPAQDVTQYTSALMDLVRIEGKVHRPPEVTFQWGSLTVMGFARNVKVRYTMFETGGIPVRAEVTLTLISLDLELDAQKISPKESPDRTKCIVLTSDSSLWTIAQQEYGDANYWREIARANNIMDPLHVPVGTSLKVPALQD